MSKVLITGGAGFIGSHLTERLVKLGNEVTVIDRTPEKEPENIKSVIKEINFVHSDILNFKTLEETIKGKEYIFHLAANSSVNKSLEKPSWSAEQNILATVKLLELAVKYGVKKIIFSSSAAVYGDRKELPIKETAPLAPASPYALDKVTGENYMKLFSRLHNIDTVSLRYFNVFGPRQNADLPHPGGVTIVINQIKNKGSSQLQGDGKQTRDMIYVDNVVNANILAMKKGSKLNGAAYNVSTGKSISICELHDKISKLMGVESTREYLPLPKGNIIHSQGDNSLAKSELGFKIEVDLEEGLKGTLDWSKNQV
ncbi:MAG: hypothetical protein COS17_00995 [Elusimicrobia bacterium CG02_land_8_20_14_3_00_37_13]|nr:MAG: hypothetical protein COS17_00995 [Elusimicrobia bacterium CG02_land_8_20_14_3_00_37_13]